MKRRKKHKIRVNLHLEKKIYIFSKGYETTILQIDGKKDINPRMSSILIDIEADEADELAIDNSKVELLKSQSNFIYYLFKTSIQYGKFLNTFYDFKINIKNRLINTGNLVKQTQKTQTKDMKQWICLYGEESERIKAKVLKLLIK